MQQPAKQEVHYGKTVWVNPTTETLRKTECLCLNCSNLKPDQSDNCHIAQSLFQICVLENIAMAITRCPMFQQK